MKKATRFDWKLFIARWTIYGMAALSFLILVGGIVCALAGRNLFTIAFGLWSIIEGFLCFFMITCNPDSIRWFDSWSNYELFNRNVVYDVYDVKVRKVER
jgi:hypothetical protein